MSADKLDSSTTGDLLARVRSGDRHALNDVLRRERKALRAFVDRHLDPRLRSRVDPSDVVQETQFEIMRRIDDFLDRRPMPFRLWTRKQAYERMLRLRRDHITHRRRSLIREQSWPDRSSLLIAKPFVRPASSPSARAERKDLTRRVGEIVSRLADADREILLLRHADDLPYEDISCLLDIEPAAARKRYGRAMIRLQRLLSAEGLLE
jgi:RNA polymerase sigma-70 factor (ECF subfamily)